MDSAPRHSLVRHLEDLVGSLVDVKTLGPEAPLGAVKLVYVDDTHVRVATDRGDEYVIPMRAVVFVKSRRADD